MSISLTMPTDLAEILTDSGFKTNGNDYWNTYPVTDGQQDWEEEIYISFKGDHFEIDYPSNEKRNKVYKRKSSVINHLKKEFCFMF